MSEISKELWSRTHHETLTNARTYIPIHYPVPILLLWRFKRQRELESQLCCVNFLWFFRAGMPSDWSSVVYQMSPAVANQTGLITASFQLFSPSLPYCPTPGLCSIAFSIFLDTDTYKRDFAALGNYSKRQSMGKHTYPCLSFASPSNAYISKQFNAVFPIYLTCSFIV